MVRRHWVRGHWRGGRTTASLAVIYCLIAAYAAIWIYDASMKSGHGGAIWWGVAAFLSLSVVAAIA